MPQVLSHTTKYSRVAHDFENFMAEKDGQLRMGITDLQLIDEAIVANHRQINCQKTRKKYREHLKHFSEYLNTVRGLDFYTAARIDVQFFMAHLEEKGGEAPHLSRASCSWCKAHSFPDGRGGCGWSASTRKGYLSAIRFMYMHFNFEENLPNRDPSHLIKSPRVSQKYEYIPSSEDMRKFLAVRGSRNETLLAHWMAYAPERRESFRRARWRDIDFENCIWHVFDTKNGKSQAVFLQPDLTRRLRLHLDHQMREAVSNPAVGEALASEDTAYVLLTKTGCQLHESTLTKLVKQRGVRAGIGLIPAVGKTGSVGGLNSKMTPHALRRSWASDALNDEVAIDVVAQALGHKDITTTRRHYARTESSRVKSALLGRSY